MVMFRQHRNETAQRMLGGKGASGVGDAPKLIRMSPLRHSCGARTLQTNESVDEKTLQKGSVK